MSTKTSADERRRNIIREAASLFNKAGYFNTSMDNIAKAVGLRKPSLYYYVSSKEEILYLIHEEFIDHLIDLHRSRLNIRMACALLIQEAMIDILDQIALFHGYVRAFFDYYHELNGDMKNQIDDKRDAYFRMIMEVVRQGESRGEFQTNDPTFTTIAFFSMCNWANQWHNTEGRCSREIALHFWNIFMYGINVAK